MKRILLISLFTLLMSVSAFSQTNKNDNSMKLTDELCDKLYNAAHEKSKELGVEISFAITDEMGNLCLFRRFGNALPLSNTLVPGKAYTSSVTRATTEDLAKLVVEGGTLYGIHTADKHIVLVTGGFPLIYNDKVIGSIGVGLGTEDEDRQIGEYIVKIFQEEIK